MIKIFKTVAILEGISYLVLISNMLIVKFMNIDLYHKLVFPIGLSHGLLFIVYIIFALIIGISKNWLLKNIGIILLASIIPFATFFVDTKYLKND
jgi:integral membrane protein